MLSRWVMQLSWIAGLLTWAVVGLPIWAALLQPATLSLWFWLGLLTHAVFGLVFSLVASGSLNRLSYRGHLLLLLLQSFLATVTYLCFPNLNLMAVLFILTASHAANIIPLRFSLLLVGCQSVVVALGLYLEGGDAWLTFIVTMAYAGFQLFALISTEATQREARAKEQLAKLNAELKATQALLAESSRVAERVRIARELHDLMGHQLTALSLNLEVANLTQGEKSRQHLSKAQHIAKELLGDVRGVVSTMRDSHLNLERALQVLVEGVPKPAIHLQLPSGLSLEDPEKAHALVRCVQEVITNTLRHAGAQNLWISIRHTPQGLEVEAHDDGRGSREIKPGNGLKGMQERLEQLGGQVKMQSQPGQGFHLEASLPL